MNQDNNKSKDEHNEKKVKKHKRKKTNKNTFENKKENTEVFINKEEKNSKSNRSNKNSSYYFGFKEVIVIILLAIFLGLFVGSFVTYKKYRDIDGNCADKKAEFVSVYNDIINDYYGDLNIDKLSDDAVEGMIKGLNDPYASFLDEETAQSYNEDLNGGYVGIGIEITSEGSNYLTVVSVYEDSPASKSGILVGDQIVSFDGVNYSKDQISELTYKIKSLNKGDKKGLTILRDGKTLGLEITLDNIEFTSVSSSVVSKNDKKIGLFQINSFTANTYKQFLEKYEEIKDENIDAIVVDLRYNGGGYLSSASDIATLFLNKGDIIYKKYDGKKEENIINENEKKIDLPVVVLINECTASGSEVFASALRENNGTTLVGTKTYGKGTIQKLQALSSGKYFKYTVMEWLTSEGNKVEGVGIVPDIEIVNDEKSDVDLELDKALEIASEK